MDMDRDISRRHIVAAAAALNSDIGAARSAQASTRIEQLAPELEKIISTSEPIQHLADGFGGPLRARPRDRCGGRKAAICCSATSTTTGG